MLSPCGVPVGMEGGKSENYLHRVLKMRSSGKENVRAGNCEQTVEFVCVCVPVLYECGECQRGEVFLPLATDKSHLSGRSLY